MASSTRVLQRPHRSAASNLEGGLLALHCTSSTPGGTGACERNRENTREHARTHVCVYMHACGHPLTTRQDIEDVTGVNECHIGGAFHVRKPDAFSPGGTATGFKVARSAEHHACVTSRSELAVHVPAAAGLGWGGVGWGACGVSGGGCRLAKSRLLRRPTSAHEYMASALFGHRPMRQCACVFVVGGGGVAQCACRPAMPIMACACGMRACTCMCTCSMHVGHARSAAYHL